MLAIKRKAAVQVIIFFFIFYDFFDIKKYSKAKLT